MLRLMRYVLTFMAARGSDFLLINLMPITLSGVVPLLILPLTSLCSLQLYATYTLFFVLPYFVGRFPLSNSTLCIQIVR